HDILPAVTMAATTVVGVGEFVHEQAGRTAGQGEVDVELRRPGLALSEPWKALEQGAEIGPAPRFHTADDDVRSRRPGRSPGVEHRVCLTDTGRRAKEDFQAPSWPYSLPLRRRKTVNRRRIRHSAVREGSVVVREHEHEDGKDRTEKGNAQSKDQGAILSRSHRWSGRS